MTYNNKYLSNKVLKFSLRNFFALHLPTILLMIVGFLIMLYSRFDKSLTHTFLIIWTMDLLPCLYLHIEYYFKNKGEIYEVHSDLLIQRKSGERKDYKVSEIDKIEVYLSPALYKGSNLHFLGIEAYHYARVYLKNGEELIITCLLTPKVEKALRQLRGVKIERKKRLFNILN